jgi:hypothetical protein
MESTGQYDSVGSGGRPELFKRVAADRDASR